MMVHPNFKQHIIPVIIQDYKSREILMLAYQNEEALKKTISSGKVWFYSRSRGRLWKKGEESHHYQIVKDILIDCDLDTIVIKVDQAERVPATKATVRAFIESSPAKWF